MKNSKLLSIATVFAVLMFCNLPSQAKIWRVNKGSNYNGTTLFGSNFGGTASYPVFQELNQVVGSGGWGSFTNGDTVHMEGSLAGAYNVATVVKKVVIIGPGYFLVDNPETSNDLYDAEIDGIDFEAGSGGSTVIGMNAIATGNDYYGYITLDADSITVMRCRIESACGFEGTSGLKLAIITQNFFPSGGNSTNDVLDPTNTGFTPPVDFIFNNNICQKPLIWLWGNGTTPANITQCKNNVFDGPVSVLNLEFTTADFSNNILIPANATVNITASPGQLSYNIGTQSSQFGTAYNNLVVPAITTLFVQGTSTDGYFQIDSGSQAYRNGSDGTDRGAFGGGVASSCYTLSGLPPIPVVYQAISSGIVNVNTGLPVTVKARTIK